MKVSKTDRRAKFFMFSLIKPVRSRQIMTDYFLVALKAGRDSKVFLKEPIVVDVSLVFHPVESGIFYDYKITVF